MRGKGNKEKCLAVGDRSRDVQYTCGGSVCAPATCVGANCVGTDVVIVLSANDNSPQNVNVASTAIGCATVTWDSPTVPLTGSNYKATCVNSQFIADDLRDPCTAGSDEPTVFTANVAVAAGQQSYSKQFCTNTGATDFYCVVTVDQNPSLAGTTFCEQADPFPVFV